MLAERIDECGGNVRHKLHIGLVDGLEAFHGGAIERHAVGEGVLQKFACRHGEVLLNTDQIGEANGDILNAFLVDKGLSISLGFKCSHGTAPFE